MCACTESEPVLAFGALIVCVCAYVSDICMYAYQNNLKVSQSWLWGTDCVCMCVCVCVQVESTHIHTLTQACKLSFYMPTFTLYLVLSRIISLNEYTYTLLPRHTCSVGVVYRCVCVCVFVCVQVQSTHIHTHTYPGMHAPLGWRIYIYIYIYMCVCVCVCVCVCTSNQRTCTHLPRHACSVAPNTYTHLHIHTHTYTYIHTLTQACMLRCTKRNFLAAQKKKYEPASVKFWGDKHQQTTEMNVCMYALKSVGQTLADHRVVCMYVCMYAWVY
jgi:hypothetical protein